MNSYKQSLWAAMHAESLFEKASLPFHRPTDYFAEMVKTDAHMAKIRQGLLDEQAGMKASEDARKLRDAKKFGKKVQVERLKERQRDKKAVGDKLESLKKSESAHALSFPFLVIRSHSHVLTSIFFTSFQNERATRRSVAKTSKSRSKTRSRRLGRRPRSANRTSRSGPDARNAASRATRATRSTGSAAARPAAGGANRTTIVKTAAASVGSEVLRAGAVVEVRAVVAVADVAAREEARRSGRASREGTERLLWLDGLPYFLLSLSDCCKHLPPVLCHLRALC